MTEFYDSSCRRGSDRLAEERLKRQPTCVLLNWAGCGRLPGEDVFAADLTVKHGGILQNIMGTLRFSISHRNMYM